jgi:hypothetical protein
LICGALADLACPNANQDQHLDDQAIRATPTYGSRLTQKGGAHALSRCHPAYAYEFEHAESCSGVRTIGAG